MKTNKKKKYAKKAVCDTRHKRNKCWIVKLTCTLSIRVTPVRHLVLSIVCVSQWDSILEHPGTSRNRNTKEHPGTSKNI